MSFKKNFFYSNSKNLTIPLFMSTEKFVLKTIIENVHTINLSYCFP